MAVSLQKLGEWASGARAILALIMLLVWAIYQGTLLVMAERERLAAVERAVLKLTRAVEILARPRQVEEWGPRTRAVGECSHERCLVAIEARRAPGAQECKLMEERTKWVVTSMRDYAQRGARPRETSERMKDMSEEYGEILFDIEIPRTTPEGAFDLRVITHYEGCPWQEDGHPPTSSVSNDLRMELVR